MTILRLKLSLSSTAVYNFACFIQTPQTGNGVSAAGVMLHRSPGVSASDAMLSAINLNQHESHEQSLLQVSIKLLILQILKCN